MRKPDSKRKSLKVRFLIPDEHKDKKQKGIKRAVLQPLEISIRSHTRGTREMFLANYAMAIDPLADALASKVKCKMFWEYETEVQELNTAAAAALDLAVPDEPPKTKKSKKTKPSKKSEAPKINSTLELSEQHSVNLMEGFDTDKVSSVVEKTHTLVAKPTNALALVDKTKSQALSRRKRPRIPKPSWHPPWKLYKVISGHTGWVRSIAVDVSNEWFATGGGAADRTIKIWDLASGTLKLSLTGHISDVRGLAISNQSPLLFSVGTDKTVKCWDLEQNKVIRSYHGHLSGVYCVALHPTLSLLFSGGRDCGCRVWDIRTKSQIMILSGHKHTIHSVVSQATAPEVITGSHDHTLRLWDLRTEKTTVTLTNHKKAVRGLAFNPTQNTFASGAADNIKVWKCPDGNFLRNMGEEPKSVVNALACNSEGVLVSGQDDGVLNFWDYSSGYQFQSHKAPPQPGSLESECGIQALTFDRSGARLITCETDKTIKMWKEDPNADETTHPIRFKPAKRARY